MKIRDDNKTYIGHIPRPNAKILRLVLLAGGSLNSYREPGNTECNVQEVPCLFEVKGPAEEVKLAETEIFRYAEKADLILYFNK